MMTIRISDFLMTLDTGLVADVLNTGTDVAIGTIVVDGLQVFLDLGRLSVPPVRQREGTPEDKDQ
jgi:hypothetical protein